MMNRKMAGILMVVIAVCVAASAQQPETAKNVIVFKETNMFSGWPANNGLWAWGNEIVVGFHVGAFDDDKRGGHPIKDPQTQRQAVPAVGSASDTHGAPSVGGAAESA